MSEVDCLPIQTEVALLRAEVIALGAKNASLQAENTGLQVKYAEVKTDNKWLMRALWILFAAVLMLIAALVLEKLPGEEKSGEKKPNGARASSLNLLFRLLKDLFQEEEVARFVRLHLGDSGTAVINGLGQPTSPDDFFLKIAIALHQHGLVGEILFDALLELRPNRRDYILQIQAACCDGIADEGLTAAPKSEDDAKGILPTG